MNTQIPPHSKAPLIGALLIALLLPITLMAQVIDDRSVVPASIRNPILLEYSGELAQAHVQLLSVNRMRTVEEYTESFVTYSDG